MIRLLKKTDKISLLDFLYQEAAYNIFPIGDIETFGFDIDFQRVYGEFDDEGNYLSILLRYKEHAVYYASETRFNVNYVEIFNNDPFDFISGKSELMNLLDPYLVDFKATKMYFCEADEAKKVKKIDAIKEVNDETSLSKLYDLLMEIDEFHYRKKSREEFIKDKLNALKMGHIFAYEQDDLLVSTASTTATTSKNAMVISVATLNNYRKKGYASLLLEKLMDYYINDLGKHLCLFYDNPEAGRIYHRLGFKSLGDWAVYERNE
ncbi:MAG: GNAT family N-acetyltransferase [Candidatus Izemoplasmataceae bacterium]